MMNDRNGFAAGTRRAYRSPRMTRPAGWRVAPEGKANIIPPENTLSSGTRVGAS